MEAFLLLYSEVRGPVSGWSLLGSHSLDLSDGRRVDPRQSKGTALFTELMMATFH